MTRLDQDTIKAAKQHLEKIKMFEIGKISSLLKCSIPNARLKLKQWQAYTSYNKNGKYYTLPQVPQFNQNGLWKYNDVGFSKHGNLKKTIVHLITTSSAGLSGRELGDILGLSPQSFLHHFRNCPGICRQKHYGVYVYFSDIDDIYENQAQKRNAFNHKSAIANISDAEAVIILAAIIRQQGLSAEDIMSLPELKRSKMTLTNIQGFMAYHGLLKKMPVSKR